MQPGCSGKSQFPKKGTISMKRMQTILLALILVLLSCLFAGCKKSDDKPELPTESTTESPTESTLAEPVAGTSGAPIVSTVAYLEEDWATIHFDPETARLDDHTVKAIDGSWSIEISFAMSEFGVEDEKNNCNAILNGFGGQTDVLTGKTTLGDYSYQTIRYTQSGKAHAYYACTFDGPLDVTDDVCDGAEETVLVYGVYIHCTAEDSAALDPLEDTIAWLDVIGETTA